MQASRRCGLRLQLWATLLSGEKGWAGTPKGWAVTAGQRDAARSLKPEACVGTVLVWQFFRTLNEEA
jgi:hypothetical protein